MQSAAQVKGVVRELQALNASVQLLQARLSKLALGGGKVDDGSVKSKVRPRAAAACLSCPGRAAA